MEACDIYISCMHYKNQNWLDNPDSLLEQVSSNLNEIKQFNFCSISVNMAQVYNVSLKQTNYDSMVMFIKGVRFNGAQNFDVNVLSDLMSKIRKQLNYIEGLYFENIDVRCSSSYSDRELGVCEPFVNVSKPTIIEQVKTSL
jgi:hypothetical protein